MKALPPEMTQRFDRMVSLGIDCRVRYQISRRLYASERGRFSDREFHADLFSHAAVTQPFGGYFFDWLIAPMHAVLATAENRFANVFDYDELDAVQPSIVEHRSLRLEYVHLFHDLIVGQAIDRVTYDAQKSKVARLAEKQMAAYADNDLATLYVRVGAAPFECTRFTEILHEVYGARNFAVLHVLMDPSPRGLVDFLGKTCTYEISDANNNKPDEDKWMGDDESWQGMLRQFQVRTLSETTA